MIERCCSESCLLCLIDRVPDEVSIEAETAASRSLSCNDAANL